MIQNRKVTAGRPFLNYQPRERGVIAPAADKVTSYAGLAKALGVGIVSATEASQKEAGVLAQEAYNRAQLEGKGKSKETQAQLLRDAREGVAEGAGRGFFDRLLTSESDAVKVFDKNQVITMSHDAQTAANRFVLDNPDMDEAGVQAGVRDIYQGYLGKAEGISPEAAQDFLKGSNTFLNKLDGQLSEKFVKQRNMAQADEIGKVVDIKSDQTFGAMGNVSADTLVKGKTNPQAFEEIKAVTAEPEDRKALAGDLMAHITDARTDLASATSLPGALRSKALMDKMYTLSDRYNSPELFLEMAKVKTKDGSLLSKKPQEVHDLYTKLQDEMVKREKTIATNKKQAHDTSQTQAAKFIDDALAPQRDVVLSGDATEEQITEYSSTFNTLVDEAKAEFKETGDAILFRAKMEQLESYQWTDRAKWAITNPEMVSQAQKMLDNVSETDDPNEFDISWFQTNAEHITPEQAKRANEIAARQRKNQAYADQELRKEEATVKRKRLNGILEKGYNEATSELNEGIALLAGNSAMQERFGVTTPTWMSEKQFETAVITRQLELSKALKLKGAYTPSWESAALLRTQATQEIVEQQKALIKEWKDNVPPDLASLKTPEQIQDSSDDWSKKVGQYGDIIKAISIPDRRTEEELELQAEVQSGVIEEIKNNEDITNIGQIIKEAHKVFPNEKDVINFIVTESRDAVEKRAKDARDAEAKKDIDDFDASIAVEKDSTVIPKAKVVEFSENPIETIADTYRQAKGLKKGEKDPTLTKLNNWSKYARIIEELAKMDKEDKE